MRLLAVGAGGLVLALLAVPVAMAVARRTGLVDRPGALKPQDRAVPYLGGAAVFVAALPGLALSRPALVGPLGGALLLGVVDDWRGLPPHWRLAGEVAVGAGVAAVVPTHLVAPVGWLAVVAVTVVLMNGVNMIDGLDGLAGGVVAVAAGAAALLLGGEARTAALAVAAGLVGFLAYNRPPARVYLGDGGAYLLGAWLAAALAWSWAPGVPTAKGVAALVLVAVPAAEVAFAVVRRLGGRVPLVEGDRRHPYDLLVARGWGSGRAAATYVGVEAALCALAVGAGAARNLAFALAAAVAAAAVLVGLAGASGTFHRPERLAG